jgi:hypothetical protein
MKNTIIFFIIYSLFISSYNLIASEVQNSTFPIVLPKEILQNHIVCYLSPLEIAMFKQTSKHGNNCCDYWMGNPNYMEELKEETRVKILRHFADTKPNKNFGFFLHNEEKRKEISQCLGWSNVSSIEGYMQVYCEGINATVQPDWHNIFQNDSALTIVCLSNNPNKQNNNGYTALMWACNNPIRTEIIELLLANKNIDVNKQNNNGNTPLIWASGYGHKEIVELLLAHQADVNKQNNNGNTALMSASNNGYKEIVELLANKKFFYYRPIINGLIGTLLIYLIFRR